MQYVSKLHLDEAEAVVDSKIHEFPVPLLPIQDGLKCESEGCFHLCVSEKRMKSHWLSIMADKVRRFSIGVLRQSRHFLKKIFCGTSRCLSTLFYAIPNPPDTPIQLDELDWVQF